MASSAGPAQHSSLDRSSVTRVGITGTGSCLPDQRITTPELQDRVNRASGFTLPAGVFQTITGICSRRIARDDEYASTLAIGAAHQALARADLDPLDIGLLIFASATRDVAEPATAHIVADSLGAIGHCFDVGNACNSFINGIDVGRSMILAGRARRVLVVTGETPTRSMRWQLDSLEQARKSFAGFTFGDAGAAVVLEPVEQGGLLDIDTVTHSEHWAVGGIAGGGSRHPRGDEHTYFHGDGRALRDVFEKIGTGIFDSLWERTGWGWQDFAKVLVHQVTMPYLDRFVEVTGVPRDKLEVTLPELGNMASATLGVQLSRVETSLRTGERLLFVGLGGGISVMTLVWEKS
ncbi:MAG: ketoacyl-ACP synthase III [Actinomycetota bacterium]|nr:ketoacyl-ACP synthase III [Actinomycetota bacterium]